MKPADHTIPVSSPSGEDYSINIWFRESWTEIMAQIWVREKSVVPMEFWKCAGAGSTMPREVNVTRINHPDTAELYDSFAVSLVCSSKVGAASVIVWTQSAGKFVQNSFVVPMREEWTGRPGEAYPPFIGDDHSFRTAEGSVYLWSTIQDFLGWVTRKKYAC